MATNEQFSGFVRQRRNLILISLVLLFVQVHTVTFNKFSIFGTELAMEKPLNPEMYVWIAFFYLLWRFYVYFHDEGEKGFETKHRTRLVKLVERIAVRKLETDPDTSKVLNSNLNQIGATDWKFIESSYGAGTPKAKWQMTLNLTLIGYKIKGDDIFIPFPAPIGVQVDGMKYVGAVIRAWLYVLFRAHDFSEYMAPFIIAAIPLLYGIYRLFFYVKVSV